MELSAISFDAASSNGYPPAALPLLAPEHPPDEFVSFLAHEIRNPLTNIKLSVDIMEQALKDNDLKIYLAIIMRSTVRINEIVNEVLKYHGVDEILSEEHSIHQMLEEVLTMAEDRIRLKNITIRKNYAPDRRIFMNKPKMKIALTNIIINAIDAMTSEKGELKLVTKRGKTSYTLQIEDNGCGISKANLEHIFLAYFTNKPGGLGLGLATTKAILHSNNVGVNVESREGEGTRFILSFETK
ncbi:MAG: HAMP domain-containing histidine kinase [Ferruginibacter sp.]|nr:HAMP domain-containing histidine kinase [Chitinophagaceae bacterium]